MSIEIDEAAIQEATKCHKGLSCLHSEKSQLCEVDVCIQENVLFVNCLNKEPCNYRMRFGISYICNCPVRKEIYTTYKY